MSKTFPLATRSSIELLPIGTRVSYHHRAGVARYKVPSRLYDVDGRKGWILTDGTLPGPEIVGPDATPVLISDYNWNRVKDMFFDWPQAGMYFPNQKVNKTVMLWPSDGFGWVMGIMRKSIGESSSGYRHSMGGYGEDYEPGYHHTLMYVDLYIVKLWYEGKDCILCPLWAVRKVEEES